MDLSRFHQGFFDEVAEHVENIESHLLAIDVNAPESADFDGIFRSAHSIKGGSGAFGFTETARFTHVLESVLDRLRRGAFGLTFTMVDVFLGACDALKGQLADVRAGTPASAVSTAQTPAAADPLTHLVRNRTDHGIESPARRAAAGKPPEGTLSLRASHQGGEVIIEIGDDGGGLNREKILKKAQEVGLPCSPDMPLRDVWKLIVMPGFAPIGGRVDIDSHDGSGTRFPIVTLGDVMSRRGSPGRVRDDDILGLLEAGNGRVARLVDELEGQHQVVIKSLEANVRHVPGIGGATVMGNGRVALVIDVASFARHAGARALA